MIKFASTDTPDTSRRMAAKLLGMESYGGEKAASRYGRMAEALMSAGASADPVGHPMQAAARAVQGIVGGYYGNLANRESQMAEQNDARTALEKEQRDATATLAKEERAHAQALELVRAKSAIEQEDPAYQAGLAKTQAETRDISAKEAFRKSLMGMLNGATPSAPDAANVGAGPLNPPPDFTAPAPGLPGVAPQSFDGGQPMPLPLEQRGPRINPPSPTASRIAQTLMRAPGEGQPPQGLQFVADHGAPAGAAPPAGAAQGRPATAPDMINTPFGPKTREEARRIGGMLMMDPQFSNMGKALYDQANAATAPGLSQPTINAIQEKQLNTTEAYSRLRSIEQGYKPEYQTIETRIGNKWNELVDSFSSTRQSLTADQKTQLAEFSAYRADALNNLNQYIKEITGAAMTNAEAERIMRAMPNPGDGVFNGDSPTVFKAKLDAAIRSSKMALARYHYLSKNGFSGSVDDMAKQLPLERMGGVIQNRTNELLKDAMRQNPGLTPQDVAPLIRQRLRAEFGIDA